MLSNSDVFDKEFAKAEDHSPASGTPAAPGTPDVGAADAAASPEAGAADAGAAAGGASGGAFNERLLVAAHGLLGPLMLRRLKRDVVDCMQIPPKTETKVFVPLTEM